MRPDLGPGTECVRECPRWKKVFKGKKVTVGHLLSCAFGRKVNVLCLQLLCKSDFFFLFRKHLEALGGRGFWSSKWEGCEAGGAPLFGLERSPWDSS